MKINYLLGLLILTLCFSCNELIDKQGEMINIKLSPSFISINQDSDVPMKVPSALRSSVSGQIIYAIQVYENDSAYCYGVFDNPNAMQIALMTERNYHFKVAAFTAGTGKGLKQEVVDSIKYYYFPNKTALSNKFYKGNALKNIDVHTSVHLADYQIKDYPEIDGFYCDKTVKIEKGMGNIDLNLLRMGFGVTFNVDNITNGTLYVMIGNDTISLTSAEPSHSSVRLFSSSKSFTKIFNESEIFSDSILIKAQWVGTSGTIISNESYFKFKRNYQKTINIKLNTTGLSISLQGWNNAPDSGLIGWWPFNGNVNDESSVKNITSNCGAILATNRFGSANKAFYFDGSASFIEITPNQSIAKISDFTLSLWMKNEGWQGTTSDRQYLFDGHAGVKTDPGNYLKEGLMLFLDRKTDSTSLTSGILYSEYDYSDGYYRKVTKPTGIEFFSQWHNIVFVRDGSTLKTYIDNQIYQSATGVSKSQLLNMLHPWYIGTFCGNNQFYNVSGNKVNFNFKGKIDDVRLYNRVLNDTEIKSLFDETE